MPGVTAAACAFWFFAVMVSEPIDIHKDGPPYRYVGGWSHSIPYTTQAECETARLLLEAWPIRHGLKSRYKAGPCFRQTFKEYIDSIGMTKPIWIRP